MPSREKGRLKIGGRTSLTRWCIRLQQTSPCIKWQTSADSHTSYTITDSLSHQKLVFPYVWVSAKYGTDVPVPPQLSLLPGGVTVRLCHEKMLVWCPPSIRPGRLPWGGSMGSYGFSCGHPLVHPLRMGEDFRKCVVGMDVYRNVCGTSFFYNLKVFTIVQFSYSLMI